MSINITIKNNYSFYLLSLHNAKIISLLIELKMFGALCLKALELKNKSLLFAKISLDIEFCLINILLLL
jgi:hypothetical protein